MIQPKNFLKLGGRGFIQVFYQDISPLYEQLLLAFSLPFKDKKYLENAFWNKKFTRAMPN